MEQCYAYAAGVRNTPLFMMTVIQHAPGAVVLMYFFPPHPHPLPLLVELAPSLFWDLLVSKLSKLRVSGLLV